MYGRNKRGCEGMFPSNYVDIRVPLQDHEEASSAKYALALLTPVGEKIRALYTFIGQEDEDLTFYVSFKINVNLCLRFFFKENDVITVLRRINEDWLYGEVKGRSGQFPSNYLEYKPRTF